LYDALKREFEAQTQRWGLRSNNSCIEHRELTQEEFRTFRLMGGESA